VSASLPFATQLRANRAPIQLVDPAAPGVVTIRVESAELWDAVRVVARLDTMVADVKSRVLAELYPNDQYADELVLKFRGWEILDENVPLSAVGATDGSIFLLAYRRRRPVR
jgi:hypothetical protein